MRAALECAGAKTRASCPGWVKMLRASSVAGVCARASRPAGPLPMTTAPARARGLSAGHSARACRSWQPAVSFDVLAPADDPIGERDVRLAAHELAHLETGSGLAPHEEPAAITLGCEEHAIIARDHRGEVRIELDHGTPALELRRAEILEPELRALHAVEQSPRAVGEWHRGALRAGDRECAVDEDVAQESSGIGGGIGRLAEDSGGVVGKPVHPELRLRCADHAGLRA